MTSNAPCCEALFSSLLQSTPDEHKKSNLIQQIVVTYSTMWKSWCTSRVLRRSAFGHKNHCEILHLVLGWYRRLPHLHRHSGLKFSLFASICPISLPEASRCPDRNRKVFSPCWLRLKGTSEAPSFTPYFNHACKFILSAGSVCPQIRI